MRDRPLLVNCPNGAPLVPIPELDEWWRRNWQKHGARMARDCESCSGRRRCPRYKALRAERKKAEGER